MEDVVDVEVRDKLKEQGFTFDLVWTEADLCTLVEINSFGVRSPIGSCLFHWIRDKNLLYGKDEKGEDNSGIVEFRITLGPANEAQGSPPSQFDGIEIGKRFRIVPRSLSSASSGTPGPDGSK